MYNGDIHSSLNIRSADLRLERFMINREYSDTGEIQSQTSELQRAKERERVYV